MTPPAPNPWQALAAERVLTDERTRASLTDAEFAPLERWALAQTDALGARAARLDADAARRLVDDGTALVRAILADVDWTVGRRDELTPAELANQLRGLARYLREPLYSAEAAARTRRALERLAARLASARRLPDGPALTARIAAAFGAPEPR